MSVLDEVRTFEDKVVERLKELEPLLREYNQLRAVAQRLGISYSPDAPGTAKASTATRRSRSAKTRSQPARSAAKGRTPRSTTAKSAAKLAGRRRSTPARTTGGTEAPVAEPPAPTAAKPVKTRAARRRGRKATSARPGQRSDDVLRVVGEQPGITLREVGERLGVDPTGLYRVANKLGADGRLRKDGTKLYPGDTRTSAQEAETAAPPTPAADAGAGSAAEVASGEPA